MLRRISSVFCAAALLLLAGPDYTFGGLDNPDFEDSPNGAWMTDGPDISRRAEGDKPSILRASSNNHFARVGDLNRQGQEGENPSRIYQWFSPEATEDERLGKLVFRYKTNLRQGEIAWVRCGSLSEQHVWIIPNTFGTWIHETAVFLPQCPERLFVDFGILLPGRTNTAGIVAIDDVNFECVEETDSTVLRPLAAMYQQILPPVPEENGGGEAVPSAPPQKERKKAEEDGGFPLIYMGAVVVLLLIVFVAVKRKTRRR